MTKMMMNMNKTKMMNKMMNNKSTTFAVALVTVFLVITYLSIRPGSEVSPVAPKPPVDEGKEDKSPNQQQQQQQPCPTVAPSMCPTCGEARQPTSQKVPAELETHLRAQAGQDRYAYEHYFWNLPGPGVFVEFGARDGVTHANTYFYEKGLKWKGALAEVFKSEFVNLAANRENSLVFNGAICAKPGEISFLVSKLTGWHGPKETYPGMRLDSISETLIVPCLTLNAFLEQAGFRHVNYMTIDTEGSEYSLLETWDPVPVVVDIIQIEVLKGAVPQLNEKMQQMMASKGYVLDYTHAFAHDTDDLFFRRTNAVDTRKFAKNFSFQT
jgi:FkbM family methyltransferase